MRREPFKFLDAYEGQDADIFFGREADAEQLYARTFTRDVVMVYGSSGTGKTSLVQCGLASRFGETDWLPVLVRWDGDFVASMHRAVERLVRGSLPDDTDLAAKVEALYLDRFQPAHLILDQFEELLVFGTEEEVDAVGRELAKVVAAEPGAKVILVVREEYLAEMTRMERSLPGLFANRQRIERMTTRAASRAIRGPCEVCGVGLQRGVVERVLEQLSGSSAAAVELTWLQVVLDKLYRRAVERSALEPVIALEDVEALGSLGDVLGDLLDEQIEALPDPALGQEVLKALVSADGTKLAASADEVLAKLGSLGVAATKQAILAILYRLVAVRLLREKDEPGVYELRHDSLAAKVYERLSTIEKELLEVRHALEGRFHERQARGVLLDQAFLDYMAPYLSRLRPREELACFFSHRPHPGVGHASSRRPAVAWA